MRLPACLVLIGVCLALLGRAQVRPLHTRDLTRLSQVQVADHLRHSDVVFVPVGAVETNGVLPSDRDYVFPLALAMALAKDADGLYMPGLVWSYPGTTVVAPSTIYLSPGTGVAYLKTIAKSLLRQGFRRQVYLSMSQGPALLTIGTLAREFFDEQKVPIMAIDMDQWFVKAGIPASAHDKVLFGAHRLAGRLEDIPLKGDYGPAESKAAAPVPVNHGLATLGKLGFSGSLTLGSWIPDVMAHGSEPPLPATAAEREDWARQGEAQIQAIVQKMRIREAMEALRQHDRFTNEVIVPKLGRYAPE